MDLSKGNKGCKYLGGLVCGCMLAVLGCFVSSPPAIAFSAISVIMVLVSFVLEIKCGSVLKAKGYFVLYLLCIIAMSFLCFMNILSLKSSGISVKGKHYQYEKILPEDVLVTSTMFKESTLAELPEDTTCEFEYPTYTKTIKCTINGVEHSVDLGDSYVASKSVDWSYGGKSYVPKDVTAVDQSKVRGVITYEDDTTRDVEIVYAGFGNNGEVVISDGTTTFTWYPERK